LRTARQAHIEIGNNTVFVLHLEEKDNLKKTGNSWENTTKGVFLNSPETFGVLLPFYG